MANSRTQFRHCGIDFGKLLFFFPLKTHLVHEVMSAESKQITIGQRNSVSETDGRYLLTNLPSGNYALKFELQGFQPFVRQNIAITQGSTLTVDTIMEVASLSESVTVTGDSPMVDTTTT